MANLRRSSNSLNSGCLRGTNGEKIKIISVIWSSSEMSSLECKLLNYLNKQTVKPHSVEVRAEPPIKECQVFNSKWTKTMFTEKSQQICFME